MKALKPVTALIVGGTLAWIGIAGAQDQQTPEAQTPETQAPEGLPATRHQEEALRNIESDLFQRLDANHDGSVSKQEAQTESALTDSWSEYDQDGNQALDKKEFSAYEATSAGASASEDIDVAAGGPTVEGLPATQHQREAIRGQLVELLDKDGDSAISRSEAQGESELLGQWDELDRNSDGKLDSSELGPAEE